MAETVYNTLQKNFHQAHEPSWAVYEGWRTVYEHYYVCVIINRYEWMSQGALWVMTHKAVCELHSNYNTTSKADHKLMNNNLLM